MHGSADSHAHGRGAAMLLVIGVFMLFVIGVVVAVAVVDDDDFSDADLCAAAATTQADFEHLLATASDNGSTAGQVRDAVDVVLVDLTRLVRAADGRFGNEVSELRDTVLDLRRGLSDVDETELSTVVQPMVEDAVEDGQAAYQRLADSIEPICTERKD